MTRTRLLTTAVALFATAVVGWAPGATATVRGVSAASPGALAHVTAAAYRYWTYWIGTDAGWTFATAGPASLIPADGSVQGWRFAVTTSAGTVSSQPRATTSFDEICGSTPAQDGRKRVALVVDPGDAAEAPPGQTPAPPMSTCVVADTDATGYQVLRGIDSVRVEGGLVCGIGGYPTGECAPVVDDPVTPTSSTSPPTPTPSATSTAVGAGSAMDTSDTADGDGSGSPWPVVAVLALIAAIGALLWWRRSRA